MRYPQAAADPRGATVFERFTDQARRTVVLASDAARAHHHDYLGTEHILLGLIRERDGTAARALESFGVSATVIDSRLTTGQGEPARSGHIPFTRHATDPRTKHARNFSARP